MIEQEILEMLTIMVEEKDIYTAGHSKRVVMYNSQVIEVSIPLMLHINQIYTFFCFILLKSYFYHFSYVKIIKNIKKN